MCSTKQKFKRRNSGVELCAKQLEDDWKYEVINGGSLERVDLKHGSNGRGSPARRPIITPITGLFY